ncbi:MAG: glycosyltransferase family 4 protein [Acidobacteriota bacterium]
MPAQRKIRVLLIAPSMRILGGQAIQAQFLLEQFRKEPSIAAGFLPIDAKLFGPLAAVPFLRTLCRLLLYLASLAATVPRYDIVHAFSASYWSYALWTLPAILAGRLFRKKVIVHYHSGEAEDHLTRWRSAVPTLALAHEIVVASEYLVSVFANFGLRSRAIFNILDASPFHYRRRERLRPVFLTNRGLEPVYNVGCVLRAFEIVQRSCPDASLAVAHDGSSRAQLESLARELKLRNTKFVGSVPRETMARLYDEADIYLMSPDMDCTPGSVLECFASGLPVVATKAGGVPFVVRHEQTGLLVDCGDHEALAASALWLLENQDLAADLAGRARLECAKYEAEPVRREWVRLYRELMGLPAAEEKRAAAAASA